MCGWLGREQKHSLLFFFSVKLYTAVVVFFFLLLSQAILLGWIGARGGAAGSIEVKGVLAYIEKIPNAWDKQRGRKSWRLLKYHIFLLTVGVVGLRRSGLARSM